MKSGTGTLDKILCHHEDVFIPDGEIHFFSVDDIKQHPAFFHRSRSKWTVPNYNEDFDLYLSWYQSFFTDASSSQVIGEDSTIYLASEKAPYRIAELLPDVHLIFILRDPVERAYSHYWHGLQRGRMVYGFEDALQYGHPTLINRGFYRKQLERYLDAFSSSQITVILFEDFISNMQACVDRVCRGIGLDSSIDLRAVDTDERNASRAPRWINFLIWQNYVFRHRTDGRHARLPPTVTTSEPTLPERVVDSINFRLRYLNLTKNKPRAMSSRARSFLQRLYAKENDGLSSLIGIDVSNYWAYM